MRRQVILLAAFICAMVALSVGAPWRDIPQAQAATIQGTATGASGGHTCALTSLGTVKCWGLNNQGQIGNDVTGVNATTPQNVCAAAGCAALLSGVVYIAAGSEHTCAILSNTAAICWGDNSSGELGDGTTTDSDTPVKVCASGSGAGCPALTNIFRITAGQGFTCARLTNNSVKCWGDNFFGQLGNGLSPTDSSLPVDVCTVISCPGPLTSIVGTSAGQNHMCAATSVGTVVCWGEGSFGQLGNGAFPATQNTPVVVCSVSGCGGGTTPLTGVTFIGAGGNHTCAVVTGGEARCWGRDNAGQLGDGTTTTGGSSTPVVVCASSACPTALTGVFIAGGGGSHSCAGLVTGGAKCWGSDSDGQLANGSFGNTDIPLDVCAPSCATPAKDLIVGGSLGALHSCGLTTARNVRCAGDNLVGQLGDGNAPTDNQIGVYVSGLGGKGLTLTVNNTGDAVDASAGNGVCATAGAVCTLRAAIQESNASPNLDTIAFNIGGTPPFSIVPASALPAITNPVVIDGYTQPSYSGTPVVQLDGASAGVANGLVLSGGSSIVRGLVINKFAGNGVYVSTSGGNLIEGNYIGTNAAGTAAFGNEGSGVYVETANNVIGGVTTTPGTAPGNLISGNSSGLLIKLDAADGNVVQGNLIGTNAAGTADLGNLDVGVYLSIGPDNNVIGGTAAGARNVISGNNGRGIAIFDNSIGNQVQGNYIGTNMAGTAAIANGEGVTIGYSIDGQASGNTIGGPGGARNVISGNTNQAVRIGESGVPTANTVIGNYIGVAANGTSALGNGSYGVRIDSASSNNIIGTSGTGNLIANNGAAGVLVGSGTGNVIRGNAIHDNVGLGIDLVGADGVNPNDPGDADTGSNNLQNFPLLSSAQTGSAIIRGTLDSTASSIFLLDFYANSSCDASSNGEGQTYLGASAVVTPSMGIATFEVAFDAPLAVGQAVTATATDTAGNTSEFSVCQTATLLALSPLAGTGLAGDCPVTTPATSCTVNQPRGMFEVFPPGGVTAGEGQAASGVAAALYYADTGNNKVRKIQPADATGTASVVAGGGGSTAEGIAATNALLAGPRDVFIAGKSLFVADTNHCLVRRVDLGSNVIRTVAGTGVCNYNGDGISATSAQLNSPRGVAVDSAGNLYIADTLSNRIRRVEHGGDGVVDGLGGGETISTIAGGGSGCALNPAPPAPFDGCLATEAMLNQPHDVFFLAEDLIVADTTHNRIRRIDLPVGTISTIAGTGVQNYTGDNGLAVNATLNNPEAVMAANNKIVIADTKNHVIRMVDLLGHPADGTNPAVAPGTITTVADSQAPCRPAGCPPGVKLSEPAGVFIVTGPTAADGALRVSNTLGQTITTAGIDPTGTHTTNIRPSVSCGNVPGISGIDWVLPVIMLGALAGRRRIGTFFTRLYIAAARRAPAPAVS